MLTEVCRAAVEVGGYRMAWVGGTSAQEKRIRPLAFAGECADRLASLKASWAELPAGTPGPLGDALRLATSCHGADHLALCEGAPQLLALPLLKNAEVLGILVLHEPARPLAPLSSEELALLQEIADNLACALQGIRWSRLRSHLKERIVQAVVGLSGPPGPPFFQNMLGSLAASLECDSVFLTQLTDEPPGRAHVLAGIAAGQSVQGMELVVASGPCRNLLAAREFLQTGDLASLYPQAPPSFSLVPGETTTTYIGHRLEASDGRLLGTLCMIFKAVPPQLTLIRAALQVFASRAAAELECMDADEEIRRLNASLEERVQQRTEQLRLANEELESFCYSVSHDLRSPLSAVEGFATLLEQALANSTEPMAERHQHFLRRIRAGMVQMGELIEALLQLARLARAPMTLEPVDMSQIAQDLLLMYQEREPARVLQAEIEPGLLVQGDARLLRQLLDNLLGNAWKFSSGEAVTHIRLARVPPEAVSPKAGGQPLFVVEDQGAGFNMAYAQKLFGPFQRLHSPSEFAGTGIGLATVQRIVQRHGGRVWGEAETGQGARFYFSLGS